MANFIPLNARVGVEAKIDVELFLVEARSKAQIEFTTSDEIFSP